MASRAEKPRWLDRRIAAPGPYLTLCLAESEFLAAIKHLKLDARPDWLTTPQADATTHHFSGPHGLAAVVCLRIAPQRKPVEIAGLLVHEAVHVWQEYCDYYGERSPGREQEAYAVQSIAQELMAEYARRMDGKQS
jgi:hypothetical protein